MGIFPAQMGLFRKSSGLGDSTDTLTDSALDSDAELEEEYRFDTGDHERFAHYVRKEKIVESAMTGKPVIALCGKKWIPSRDPNKFPICPTCKEIHSGLRKEPDAPNNE